MKLRQHYMLQYRRRMSQSQWQLLTQLIWETFDEANSVKKREQVYNGDAFEYRIITMTDKDIDGHTK